MLALSQMLEKQGVDRLYSDATPAMTFASGQTNCLGRCNGLFASR